MPQRTRAAFGVVAVCLATPTAATAATPDGSGPWMDVVTAFRQGPTAAHAPVLAARSILADALGPADAAATDRGFVSLGFGGSITLSSDAPICDGPGADLRIVEVTLGLSDTSERAAIDVSVDGRTWTRIAASLERSGDVGLPPDLPEVRYVRITDTTPLLELTRLGADGYDVDGVEALHAPSACAAPPAVAGSAASSSAPPGPEPSPTAAAAPVPPTRPPTSPTIGCDGRRLIVEDIARSQGRLRVVGVADRALAGRRVAVRAFGGDADLGAAVIAPDGTFALTTRVVALGAAARVIAVTDSGSSAPLRVDRRLVTRTVSLRAGRLTWTGRLLGPVPPDGTAVTLQRRTGCGPWTAVAGVRTRPSGGFSLRVPLTGPVGSTFRLKATVASRRGSASSLSTFSTTRSLTSGA